MSEAATLESSGLIDNAKTQNRTLKRRRYINSINYSNFNHEPLQVIFKHKIFARDLSVNALPSPCVMDSLELEWVADQRDEMLEQFDCIKILIPDGENFLSIMPEDYCLNPGGMTISLPKTAEVLNRRESERFPGNNIKTTIMQNGCFYEGLLINFNPDTFLISLNGEENSELRWINRDDNFHILLKKNNETIFAGGSVLTATREGSEIVHSFKILKSEIQRFNKKKYRGERYDLQSPAYISFIHPLSNERCRAVVTDISASGMALKEEASCSMLIPGLMIPELELHLQGGKPLKCRTQVIYRKKEEEIDDGKVKCGMAIIDMNPHDHAMLLNFVHQENDWRASVCSPVDSNALWKFFFESGFIYPEKYKHLSSGKEQIKQLYDRLYTKSPAIARHFIYQEDNRIQGHMSMLRSYENSWLMHHHAAATTNSHNAGLHVLNQVSSFSNNSYRIRSLHMLYLICYYREDNRFPKRVFGDIAKNADNLSQLSLDTVAYFHHYRNVEIQTVTPEGWSLDETTSGDLKNLESFYRNRSDGLMLKAMNLTNGSFNNESLFKAYEESGFNRNLQLFSINFLGECRGIIMADQSEAGLNMSNLTNSLKVFIINPNGLTRDLINSFIHEVSGLFQDENRIPVLMYPENSAEDLGLPREKSYTLWVLNTEASDAYFKHLKTLLKKIQS